MSLMQVGLLIRIRLGWLVEDSMNGSPFQWRINWKEHKTKCGAIMRIKNFAEKFTRGGKKSVGGC